ncbi:type I DNA topoisomerase [Fuchsiella alkaliacetigena]|uniref:type I DNA topoisomerase n=1 Tax=Fuchsiella alkaliacetigena TaxID=957042 RepID=UPI00200B06C9|nr:type I DNA topoisomerase [Fuchsiella alkaliacetigena]MCK8824863.1 type I DNA topoisomerase [Fuchsiella alkaliacetigena]
MGYDLVVVESPAKAKTISKYLGKGYKVQSSLGHFRDLPKSELAVDVENNFTPTYVITNQKALANLKKYNQEADTVYLASDPDREGEAIGWHVKQALDLSEDDYQRIVFNEITKSGIQRGINNPRQIDLNRVNSQQTRRILDRLVGYKLSPLLWKFIRRGLSAGRVQSVALKMVVDLERKIEAFNPQDYWLIKGDFANDLEGFKLNQVANKKVKKSRLYKEKQVKKLKEDLAKGDRFAITSLSKEDKKKYPYPPFTTSTLQQTAYKSLRFPSKKTMYLAQKLYEGVEVNGETVGLITYMRTDSIRVSKEAKGQAQKFIKDNFGSDYTYNYSRNVSKNAQDGHEAIRPTSIYRTPNQVRNSLSQDQYKLYRLIWNSFLNSQLAPMEYQQLEILTEKDDYQFRGLVNKITFDGFFANLKPDNSNYKSELPDLNAGEVLELSKLDVKQKETKPPQRYSESKMVKSLEKKNIGRPSTFSSIISTLKKRNYIKVKKGKFHPTTLGITVNDFLVEHFPDLINIDFTAEMEEGLDGISRGDLQWQEYLQEFWTTFEAELKELANKDVDKKAHQIKTDVVCSKCDSDMLLKEGKTGKFLGCGNYPDCKNTVNIPRGIRIDSRQIKDNYLEVKERIEKKQKEQQKKKSNLVKTDYSCSNGNLMVLRDSRRGKFLGCSKFPKCDCKETISIPDGFELPAGKEIKIKDKLEKFKEAGGKYGHCPECESGILRKRKGSRGPFLGCSNYPKCKHTAQFE